QEAYDLFAVFARFEYAMKKGGYRRKDFAEAAWATFAKDLSGDFFARMQASPEVAIYFVKPPEYLVNDENGSVRWSGATKVPTTTAELFECIKTARNNLFHGDKRHDNGRDTDFMRAALFVLNSAFHCAENDRRFDAFIGEMEHGL